MPHPTSAAEDDSAAGFRFPAIGRKKVTAAFDGGRLTSDCGVLLLAQAEREMRICTQLAACIVDRRDPSRVVHALDDILRARVLAITCGYEDADDLDALRDDPGFRLALGKLPGSGPGLASQPTMSRWENVPTTRELARLMRAMIAIYCTSYTTPPGQVTLDIDDTCDVVHGYGPDIEKVQDLFVNVLGFYLTEQVLLEDNQTQLAIFLSCSNKAHDIALVRHEEPGKLHHISFLLESWERVLRAADLMSMSRVPIDIGPTRHGITRGSTIYAFDPSGNRFETFCGGYQPYPDWDPLTWSWDEVGAAIFYHDRALNERFLSVVT